MCSFASRGRLHYIGFLLLVLLIGSQSSRAQPATAGKWTDVISLPIIPIAAALLPDGKVLGWSTNDLTTFEFDLCPGFPLIPCTPSQTLTSLTTPQSGASTFTPVTNP